MKIGNAVKMKFVTNASKRRAQRLGAPFEFVGIIIETEGNTAKVIFPAKSGRAYLMAFSSLELVA